MKNFTQVVVWPGTLIAEGEIPDFEQFMLNELNTRVKYIETVITKPDKDNADTGGRSDVLFYVNSEDIAHFAMKRFAFGMRWIEDALGNEDEDYSIYPEHVVNYRTW